MLCKRNSVVTIIKTVGSFIRELFKPSGVGMIVFKHINGWDYIYFHSVYLWSDLLNHLSRYAAWFLP